MREILQNKDGVVAEFYRRRTNLEDVREAVNRIIETYKSTIPYAKDHLHSYKSRLKSEDRFLKKAREGIQSRDFTEKQILNKIYDILGFRLITLYKSSLPILRNFVKDHFKIHKTKIYLWEDLEDLKPARKVEIERTKKTGYASVHFIVTLRDRPAIQGKKNIGRLKFEIQCRTITQEAWAESQHDVYERGEPPLHLKNEYRALSKYLDAATDQMQALREEFERIKGEEIAKKFRPLNLRKELREAGFKFVNTLDVNSRGRSRLRKKTP